MADTKRYQLLGGLTPDSRPDRVEVGSKTLEISGEPVSLTEKQAIELSQHVNLREVPEGVTVAEFGPSIEEQLAEPGEEKKTSQSGAKTTQGSQGGGESK
jgi:hypothetical protein